MKRVFLYIIIYVVVMPLFLSACHHDHDEPTPRVKARTVIVYMMAENSLSNFAQSDINEMVKASNLVPDSVNFIIYLDKAMRSQTDTGLPLIYHLTNGGNAQKSLKEWYTFREDHISTDSVVMLQNLRRIVDAFPASHYGLVFWSHGSGWIPQKRRTIGIDNGRNERNDLGYETNITALRWVLEQLPHTDYIFFDACFMQSVETAYELRNVTDWMVGSPAETPGYGAPYDMLMPALCSGDAEGIAQAYYDYYPNSMWGAGVLLSAIRSDHLDALASVTARYIPALFADRAEVSTSGFQWYCDDYSRYTYCWDMSNTMYSLLAPDEYDVWRKAFDDAVPLSLPTSSWIANKCRSPYVRDVEHCGAVSMFVPNPSDDSDGWNEALHQTQWYKAAGWNQTGW